MGRFFYNSLGINKFFQFTHIKCVAKSISARIIEANFPLNFEYSSLSFTVWYLNLYTMIEIPVTRNIIPIIIYSKSI